MGNQGSGTNGGTILAVILATIMVAELVVIGFLRPGLFVNRNTSPENEQTKGKAEDTVTEQESSETAPAKNNSFPEQSLSMADKPGHDWEPYEGEEADYQVTGSWSSQSVASGVLTEDNLTLKSSDGASMTVDPCFLEEDTQAEIRKVPGTIDYKVGDATVPLTMYEFYAEGISDDTYMTLEIPFEKPAEGEVGAGYYDSSTGTIWPVASTYDEESGKIRISATHLSGYCGFPIDNEGTNRAMLGYMCYVDGYDRLYGGGNTDALKNLQILEKAVDAGSSWAVADEIVSDLGEMATPADAVISGLGVVGDIESRLSAAHGAGSTIVKNSYGTVGEIMSTMWGKNGNWGTAKRYGGSVTVVEIEDKLKSTYPASKIEKIGKGMNIMNTSIAVYRIFELTRKGDKKGAAWESAKLYMDRVLQVVAQKMAYPALNVYLVGVALFAYGLDKIYSETLEGRKMVYMKAYTKYYNTKGADGGYRSAATWRKKFVEIMKSGGGIQEIEDELDRYVNEFWVRADNFDTAYLANVMTEEEKAAWGVAGQAGLNEEIKKEISDSYKAELRPLIENILYVMNERNQRELLETYMSQYESLCRELNQVITFNIIDGGKEEGKDSEYAGCVVRFKDLKGKVKSTKGWETTLNKNGQGVIKVTFLAHMMANAGTTLEVVEIKDDEETVVLEQSFKLELPVNRIILDFPEKTGAEWINGYWISAEGKGGVLYYEIKGNNLIIKLDLDTNDGVGNWYNEVIRPYEYDSKTKTITVTVLDYPTKLRYIDDDHFETTTYDKVIGEYVGIEVRYK